MTDQIPNNNFQYILSQLKADLARLVELSRLFDAPHITNQLSELLERITGHSFTLAIVGEFKRGKSTFINALLGGQVLPADVAPTSATLNRITYGNSPSATIYFKEELNITPKKIKIEYLSEYVTKLTPSAEEIASTIKEAVITYPASFCKNNVDIIDTPGLQDEGSLTTTTLHVLRKVDVAVMVIMADSPFSKTEGDFLDRILTEGVQKVIFVITAVDRIKPADRQKVINGISKRIEEKIRNYAKNTSNKTEDFSEEQFIKKFGKPILYALSGQMALEGKISGDAKIIFESNILQFEDMLGKFLALESETFGLKTKINQLLLIIKELTDKIVNKQNLINTHPAIFEYEKKIIETLLELLENIGRSEIEKIKSKTVASSTQSQIILKEMVNEYEKTAISNLINQMPITREQLDSQQRYNQLVEDITKRIEKSADAVADKFAEKICTQVLKDLQEAIPELNEYVIAYDRTMLHIASVTDRISTDTVFSKLGKLKVPKDIITSYEKLQNTLKNFSPKSIHKKISEKYYIGNNWITPAFSSYRVKEYVMIPEAEYLKRLAFVFSGVGNFKEQLIISCVGQLRKLDIMNSSSASVMSTNKFIGNSFEDLVKFIQIQIQLTNEVNNEIYALGEKINALTFAELNKNNSFEVEVFEIKKRLIEIASN